MEATKIAEIVEMFNNKIPVTAIAEEMNIGTQTVYTILEGQGISTVPVKRVFDEEAIIKSYQDTTRPVKATLEEFKISFAILYAILASHEIPVRQITQKSGRTLALEAAIEMYKQGHMLHVIKAETGVHQPTLHAALHERNIPLRRARKSNANTD